MNTEDKIKVMQAYVDGKDIEWVTKGSDNWTLACDVWNWIEFFYRIKPEVKEMTVSEIEKELGYIIKVVK